MLDKLFCFFKSNSKDRGVFWLPKHYKGTHTTQESAAEPWRIADLVTGPKKEGPES